MFAVWLQFEEAAQLLVSDGRAHRQVTYLVLDLIKAHTQPPVQAERGSEVFQPDVLGWHQQQAAMFHQRLAVLKE